MIVFTVHLNQRSQSLDGTPEPVRVSEQDWDFGVDFSATGLVCETLFPCTNFTAASAQQSNTSGPASPLGDRSTTSPQNSNRGGLVYLGHERP